MGVGSARKFEIDIEKEWELVCGCCGERCKTFLGFVHEEEVTRAAYYVRIVENNPSHEVLIALGIGDWGGTAADRIFVGVKGDCGASVPKFDLIDPDDTPWADNDVLGRKILAKYGRGSEIEKEANVLAAFILASDPRIINK